MHVSEVSRSVRILVLTLLSLMAIAMTLVSMRLNFLFGSSLGQTEERAWVFGAISVIVDLWKALGLIAVVALWRARRYVIVLIAAVVWILCFIYAIASALGFAAEDRAALGGAHANVSAIHNEARDRVRELEKQRALLVATRAVAIVETALTNALSRPIVVGERVRGTVASLSSECQRADARTTDSCAEVAQLRDELARAHEAQRLEQTLVDARASLANARSHAATRQSDAQAEMLHWLSAGWLPLPQINHGLVLLMGLVLECISAFAPLVLTTFAAATSQPVAPDHAASRSVEVGRALSRSVVMPAGNIIDFLTECTRIVRNEQASSEALFAAYKKWCAKSQCSSRSGSDFFAEVDGLLRSSLLANAVARTDDTYIGLALLTSNKSDVSDPGL